MNRWLAENSGGNVFFALETLRELLEQGVPKIPSEMIIPKSVQHLIDRRIKRFSPITQRILQAASVLRENFVSTQLANMIGVSEFVALDALEETERAGFIAENKFQHDLVRQSIYKNIQDRRRKALHARAATLLEETTHASIVAEHWHLAGNTKKAFSYRVLAAEDFYQHGLFSQALTSLEIVIQQASDSESRLTAQQKSSWLLYELGQIGQSKILNELVLQEAQIPLIRAYALHLQAALLNHEGQIEAARVKIRQAMQLMQTLQPDDVMFHSTAAVIAQSGGNYQEAIEYLEPAITQLRTQGVTMALITCINGLGAAYNELDNPELGSQYCQEAWQLAKSINAKSHQVAAAVNFSYVLHKTQKI